MRIFGILLAGLLLSGICVNDSFAIADVSDLEVDDPGNTNITVSATVAWSFQGFAELQVELTNGLLRRYFAPSDITTVRDGEKVNIIMWSNVEWNPYFVGEYDVRVTQYDILGETVDSATGTTNHTVTRTVGGEVISMEYATNSDYLSDASLLNDVVITNAKLHSIGMNYDQEGMGSLGCNLLNATVNILSGMTNSDMSLLFDDISEFYPHGTYFRFTTDLHARPVSIMGLGNLVRYQWIPQDTNSMSGAGRLIVDLQSCSPWRSDASRPIESHVGFAPLFNISNTNMSDEMAGALLCTTAHYQDVQPVMEGSDDSTGANRMGLDIGGHAGTNSYLKIFVPDAIIQSWGVTDPTNQLVGYTDGTLVGGTNVVLTRIEGGTTNIVYDWDGDGLNDSGYVAEFTFEFPDTNSSLRADSTNVNVVAEFGKAATNAPRAEVYRLYSYGSADSTYEHLWTTSEAEKNTLDSWPSWQYEGIAWYAFTNMESGTVPLYRLYASSVKQHHYTIDTTEYTYLDGNGTWTGEGVQYYVYASQATGTLPAYRFYHSGLSLHHFTISETEKSSITNNPSWGYVYEGIGFYVYETAGTNSVAGPANVVQYKDSGLSAGSAVVRTVWRLQGDYDGDGVADVAAYEESTGNWYVLADADDDINQLAPVACWGGPGMIPVPGDYDGDSIDDLAVYDSTTCSWFVRSLDGRELIWDVQWGAEGLVPVGGDFDGDGVSDIAVMDEASGSVYYRASGSNE